MKKIDVGEVKNESEKKLKTDVKEEDSKVAKMAVHPYRRLAWNNHIDEASH